MLTGGIGLLSAALAACAPPQHPIVAEVFYDAIGDDTGYEFVEILNRGPQRVPLGGLRLEAGDGSGLGRWTLRWTAAPGDSIAPGARFVIGGARVAPPPQAIATLDLQNGPDAVRLVWPDGAIEVVGYGAHEFGEYVCNAPAADAPSGQSLARVPDDADLGSNALDFRPATPSPGRANRPDHDVAWVTGSLAVDPEQPAPGEAVRLSGAYVDRGAVAIAAGAARLVVRGSLGAAELIDVALAGVLAPGDTALLEVELPGLPEGRQTLACRLELGGDDAPDNDVDSLRVRVGPGPLEVTEIQFHPQHGEGEWVEIRNRFRQPVDPTGFTFSDRGRARGRPSAATSPCEPDSLVLFAQDRAALLAHAPRLDSTRVWTVSPWPSLNNSNDSTGVADEVVLREVDGTPCSRQPYSASGVAAGVPLERGADGDWRPAIDSEGTPLQPPRPPAPLARRFELFPRRVRAGAGTIRFAWSLPWTRARAALDVYDLSGALVTRAAPELAVSGRGERDWRIDGLAAGLYVVVLRARAESGGESLSESRILRIEGVEP